MSRFDLSRREPHQDNVQKERIVQDQDFYETMPMAASQPIVSERVSREEVGPAYNGALLFAERIVSYAAGVVETLLGLRLLLALLGDAGIITTANAFARFIYQVTNPLVAPFVSLFNSGTADPGAWTIAFAMLIYGLAAYAIVRLFRLGQPRDF